MEWVEAGKRNVECLRRDQVLKYILVLVARNHLVRTSTICAKFAGFANPFCEVPQRSIFDRRICRGTGSRYSFFDDGRHSTI